MADLYLALTTPLVTSLTVILAWRFFQSLSR